MNQFTLKVNVNGEHWNARQEGSGEKTLAGDLKVKAYLPVASLLPMIGAESVENFEATFWDSDGAAVGQHVLSVAKKYEEVELVILANKDSSNPLYQTNSAKLSKVACTLTDNKMVNVTFNLSFGSLEALESGTLHQLCTLEDGFFVSLMAKQGELPLDDNDGGNDGGEEN